MTQSWEVCSLSEFNDVALHHMTRIFGHLQKYGVSRMQSHMTHDTYHINMLTPYTLQVRV